MNLFWWAAFWEGGWWLRRKSERNRVFAEAQARARALGIPLVVVGAPDSGPTIGPGCGDVTLDIATSACPNFIQADITKPLPITGPVVVFVSCVLDYVDDLDAALQNLRAVAGAEIYNVRVEPWTFVHAGIGYQRVKNTLPWSNGRIPFDG